VDKKKKALEEAAELAKQISLEEKEQPSPPSETSSASAASGASPDAGFINQGGGMKTNRDFNDRGYLIRLSQTLQQSFVPPLIPQGSGERVTTVLFKIHANGTISDMQVIKSSGHRRVDRSALQAVQTVAQFEPLPGGISDLEVSCDFKVD
jgi:TonB family protein